MRPVRALSKQRWAWPPWSLFWCCAWAGSPRYRCKCAVLMLRARRPGWPPVAMSGRRRGWRAGLRQPAQQSRYVGKANFWWLKSPPACGCCRHWRSAPKALRWLRTTADDDGTATVLAAVMVAALLCVAGSGICVGSVVVGRHRAQAAADLAALAAATRLPAGAPSACALATTLAAKLAVYDIDCTVDGLDVVVTAQVPVFVGWSVRRASAVARAGPVSAG